MSKQELRGVLNEVLTCNGNIDLVLSVQVQQLLLDLPLCLQI